MNSIAEVQAPATAEASAFAMVALAADPAGAKARLKEIAEATKASDTAREAAEKAMDAAEEKQRVAGAARDAVAKREADFHTWVASKELQLSERERNASVVEQKQRVADSELQRRENELQIKTARHNELIAHLKSHLANIGA